MQPTRIHYARRFLEDQCTKWPAHLTPVPTQQWPLHSRPDGLAAVLRSNKFLVQIYFETPAALRLTVCRTELDDQGRWKEGITWDELMQLKREAEFGSEWAVEIFPPDSDIVNVANMRHLWVLPGKPAYGWSNPRPQNNPEPTLV